MRALPRTAIAILALLCAATRAQQVHVSNPDASFLDVSARRSELKDATSARVLTALKELKPCNAAGAPPPHGKMYIPDRYLSGGHGATNIQEHDASQPYYAVQNEAAHGANSFFANLPGALAYLLVRRPQRLTEAHGNGELRTRNPKLSPRPAVPSAPKP